MERELKNSKETKLGLSTLLEGWKTTRQLTLDWIDTLSLEQLNQELPRPGLNSFVKHIYEMGEVQKIYTDALIEEKPNMEEVTKLTFESEKFTANSKEELKKILTGCDKKFFEAVEKVKDWQQKISVFGIEIPKWDVIELLIRHETLHHGQFIAFGYILGIQFPQSWVDVWALPVK